MYALSACGPDSTTHRSSTSIIMDMIMIIYRKAVVFTLYTYKRKSILRKAAKNYIKQKAPSKQHQCSFYCPRIQEHSLVAFKSESTMMPGVSLGQGKNKQMVGWPRQTKNVREHRQSISRKCVT